METNWAAQYIDGLCLFVVTAYRITRDFNNLTCKSNFSPIGRAVGSMYTQEIPGSNLPEAANFFLFFLSCTYLFFIGY